MSQLRLVLVVGFMVAAGVAQCGPGWTPIVGGAPNGPVRGLAPDGNGGIVAVGDFTQIGGMAIDRVALWSGASWSGFAPLPAGFITGPVLMANGDVVVFLPNGLQRWNGIAWQPIPPPTSPFIFVEAAVALPNGQLFAAGPGIAGYVARWDGATWLPLGAGLANWVGFPPMPTNPVVRAAVVASNGDLIVGGQFRSAGGVAVAGLARWNGTAWSAVSSSLDSVTHLLQLADGQWLVGGYDFGGNYVVCRGPLSALVPWSTAQFSPGSVYTIAQLPDGDLLFGGSFITVAGQPLSRLARWNGQAWSAVGSGANGDVYRLCSLGEQVWIGGAFTSVGSIGAHLGVLGSTCAAALASLGATCAGSSVLGALQAVASPWVGAPFRTVAAGVPATSIPLTVFGFGPASTPLPGAAGCLLLAAPDLTQVVLPAGGVVTSSLVIPDQVSLVGTQLWHQVVPVSFPAIGIECTATNALQLTIGAF